MGRDFGTFGLAFGLHYIADRGERIPREAFRMRRAAGTMMILLLALLHAPSSAQALMSSFWPDLFPFGTTEPAMLALTGAALLTLARR